MVSQFLCIKILCSVIYLQWYCIFLCLPCNLAQNQGDCLAQGWCTGLYHINPAWPQTTQTIRPSLTPDTPTSPLLQAISTADREDLTATVTGALSLLSVKFILPLISWCVCVALPTLETISKNDEYACSPPYSLGQPATIHHTPSPPVLRLCTVGKNSGGISHNHWRELHIMSHPKLKGNLIWWSRDHELSTYL